MKWESPSFVEVNMNAEINAYQDDLREELELASRQPMRKFDAPTREERD